MKMISPLRYPGGKTALADIIANKVLASGSTAYAEPFAGGAGAGLSLLMNGHIDVLILNDKDPAVYSIWDAVLNRTEDIIEFIENVPIDIDQYRRQKSIYEEHGGAPSFELGCAAFFLNRANVSGIITGGPIGGYEQTGKCRLDDRFCRQNLIRKIRTIAGSKSRIHIFNEDAVKFIQGYITPDTFLYLDPPYIEKAKKLYRNSFTDEDHVRLRDALSSIRSPWLLSYDDCDTARDLYKNCRIVGISLTHSAANSGKKQELLIER